MADKANSKAGKSRDTGEASRQLYVSSNNLHHETVIYVRDVKAAAHRCGGKTLKFCYRKVKRVIFLIKTYGVPFVCQKSLDPCKKLNLIVSEQIWCARIKADRLHTKHLHEVCRSVDWLFLDTVEIKLIAAGLLEQVPEETGHATVRVTASGIAPLILSIQRNWQNRLAHEILANRIDQEILRYGRVVWTGLRLRTGLTAGVGEPVN